MWHDIVACAAYNRNINEHYYSCVVRTGVKCQCHGEVLELICAAVLRVCLRWHARVNRRHVVLS